MFRYVPVIVASLALAVTVQAGKFNKKLNIGDPAPVFVDLEATDGKKYSLDSFADKDVLVVCITCNHCPVAVAYEDRIIGFVSKYCKPGGRIGFIAINVNNLEADRLPKMKERAKAKGFNFVYAYDPSQKIGRALGASVTPEFFVFNKDRKLVYMGAMDDSMNQPKVNYLESAVKAALAGKTAAPAETRARGCSVKYEKK
ncbi:MAG: thioredoxin family protein [Gemmatales bacterium]|nr:MAG: thioredoxin family protein [Gemmatales bacterium]